MKSIIKGYITSGIAAAHIHRSSSRRDISLSEGFYSQRRIQMDCCHHCNYYYTDCACHRCEILLGLPPDTTEANYIPLTCGSPTVASKPDVIEYVVNSQGALGNPDHRCYGLSCRTCEETTNYTTHNNPQEGEEQDHLQQTNKQHTIIDLTREEEIIDLTNTSDEESTDKTDSTTVTLAQVNIQRSEMNITIKI